MSMRMMDAGTDSQTLCARRTAGSGSSTAPSIECVASAEARVGQLGNLFAVGDDYGSIVLVFPSENADKFGVAFRVVSE